MSSLLVLRGHAFRPPGEIRVHGVDWRPCLASQRTHVLEPLKERYGPLDVALCMYDSVHKAHVMKDYGADEFVYGVSGWDQRTMAIRALEYAQEKNVRHVVDTGGPYDLVVVTRFDIEWLSSPLTHPNFVPSKVNYLWREWNETAWANQRRVCDVFQSVPGPMLEGFTEGVRVSQSNVCLHSIYLPVAARVGEDNINVVLGEKIHDSNTDADPTNPFYRIRRT